MTTAPAQEPLSVTILAMTPGLAPAPAKHRQETGESSLRAVLASHDSVYGRQAFRRFWGILARRVCGKGVAYLEPGAYGGEKDASAAWNAGAFAIAMPVAGSWATPTIPRKRGAHPAPPVIRRRPH